MLKASDDYQAEKRAKVASTLLALGDIPNFTGATVTNPVQMPPTGGPNEPPSHWTVQIDQNSAKKEHIFTRQIQKSIDLSHGQALH